jgi:sugar lactone lactonase YvrE
VIQRLFVSEYNNNRVMVFSTASLSDGPNATNVIGQTSFTASTAAESQTGLDVPVGIAYDANNSRLFVLDYTGADLLVYNAGPSVLPANTASASYVLGTTSFSGTTMTTTQSGLAPYGGVIAEGVFPAFDPGSGRLFVPDPNNNRVLIFDATTISTRAQQYLIPGYFH